MNWQLLAVAPVVAWAAFYLARRLIRTLRIAQQAEAPASGCGGCSSKCQSGSRTPRVLELIEIRNLG